MLVGDGVNPEVDPLVPVVLEPADPGLGPPPVCVQAPICGHEVDYPILTMAQVLGSSLHVEGTSSASSVEIYLASDEDNGEVGGEQQHLERPVDCVGEPQWLISSGGYCG